jgi:hypothetical protein
MQEWIRQRGSFDDYKSKVSSRTLPASFLQKGVLFIKLALITVAGARVDVLPHMLSHYQALGVDDFIIHAHAQACDDSVLEDISRSASKVGAKIASTNVGPWITNLNSILYTISRSSCSNDDWFIIADQDELQVYPDDLRSIISYCDRHGYTYIEGCLIDRLSADGKLLEVHDDRSVWEQFPLGSIISGALLGAVINKVVAVKGNIRLGDGQHLSYSGIGCPIASAYVPVHHFKWVQGLLAQMERRVDLNSRYRNPNNDLYTAECRRFLEYYGKEGRINLNDPSLLVAHCNPDYLYWEKLKEWRRMAHLFAPELAMFFHRERRFADGL